MTWLEMALLAGLAVACGLAAGLGVGLRRERTRTRAAAAAATARADELRDRLDTVERRLAQPGADAPGFVITGLAETREPVPAPARLDGRLFADVVLRESVVKTVALAHGVRRALSPENRFQMRYEYLRGVKRARRQRRTELRRVRRLLQRGLPAEPRGEDAA